MSTLGERIKYARESKGYLQSELAKLIGVKSSGVISNWEKDLNKPDAEKIVKLCEVTNVSVSFLLDYYGKSSTEIEPREFDMIKKYRSLDQHGKETVDIILDRESDRLSQMQSAAVRQSAARIYTYMHKIACAGTGYIFDDIPTDTIEAPYMEGADFIIGVSGDSMEPTYYDGDMVYVRKQETVQLGDIGIFVMRNECYIKELGEYGLLSHNEEYEMIPGDESIQCVGKVLGRVEK